MENIIPSALSPGHAVPRAPELPSCSEAVDFERLYQRYSRRVYWWCARIVGDNADAEDLTQDSFLQLFRTIHKFRGESCFSTWFHRVVVNVALGRLRKKSIHTFSLDSPAESDQENQGSPGIINDPVAPPAHLLDRMNLDLALAQLPSVFRRILVLHDVHGYRHVEIAKMLGVKVGTSKSYLHRARRRMRTLLASGGRRPELPPAAMRTRDTRNRVFGRTVAREPNVFREMIRARKEAKMAGGVEEKFMRNN
ncbi:MAG TPA: RNA polymerase sigma factor [Terriglobia bacterium]|nr:RNA polymerase sigma factor [Terriglobia bacterium]